MDTCKMAALYFNMLFISICITICNGISPEYFNQDDQSNDEDDSDSEGSVEITNLNNAAEARKRNRHSFLNYDAESDDYEAYYTDDEDVSNDLIIKKKRKPFSVDNNISTVIPVNNTIYTTSAVTPLKLRTEVKNLSTCKLTTLFDLFKEYEYVYDYPHQRKSTVLRLDDSHNSFSGFSFDMKFGLDLGNLVPAMEKMVIPNENNRVNRSVWYVPARYPCWNLPIIFAQLGSKRTAPVFSILNPKLENIIHVNEKKLASFPKSVNVTPQKSINKWCQMKPCFGDHTLCLFSDNIYSSMCDKGYKVIKPTKLLQIVLVNTVNTMRNRIASGLTVRYAHLPKAANMKQIMYDLDLETMARVWLAQCLPGPAPCASFQGKYVTMLECTKYADNCCIKESKMKSMSNCIPRPECSISPIVGCLHTWFWTAGKKLSVNDVKCGHSSASTYSTVQLLWAETNKIGCAYGEGSNGDVRVVCNFSPGTPFHMEAKYYCGFIAHTYAIKKVFGENQNDINDLDILSSLGINWKEVKSRDNNIHVVPMNITDKRSDLLITSNLDTLSSIYKEKWIREHSNFFTNGTEGFIARLVVRYKFIDETEVKCDEDVSIYVAGEPGSLCTELGRRFGALCYNFRDPSPAYRLIAVLAPVALFSLILFDLFSGAVRHTNY